jgi:hypothetical protein
MEKMTEIRWQMLCRVPDGFRVLGWIRHPRGGEEGALAVNERTGIKCFLPRGGGSVRSISVRDIGSGGL